MNRSVTVVGGGLAVPRPRGSSRGGVSMCCFWKCALADNPAHSTEMLAEVVCSNSFARTVLQAGRNPQERVAPIGQPYPHLRRRIASSGGQGARCGQGYFFSKSYGTARVASAGLDSQGGVRLPARRADDRRYGPLTSPALSSLLQQQAGTEYLSFFDAVAPVVVADSIDMSVAFRRGRWGQEEDYINCPLRASGTRRSGTPSSLRSGRFLTTSRILPRGSKDASPSR